MPRRPSTGDPLLKGADWLRVRAYWIQRQDPCARCGGAITYTPGYRGRDALDVGHVVGRDEARRRGWTREQINHVSNTQPEHAHCSRSAGATYRNQRRGYGSGTTRREPIERDEW